jgi:hypothetical protein
MATALFGAADARRGGGGGTGLPPVEVLAPLIVKNKASIRNLWETGRWAHLLP